MREKIIISTIGSRKSLGFNVGFKFLNIIIFGNIGSYGLNNQVGYYRQ